MHTKLKSPDQMSASLFAAPGVWSFLTWRFFIVRIPIRPYTSASTHPRNLRQTVTRQPSMNARIVRQLHLTSVDAMPTSGFYPLQQQSTYTLALNIACLRHHATTMWGAPYSTGTVFASKERRVLNDTELLRPPRHNQLMKNEPCCDVPDGVWVAAHEGRTSDHRLARFLHNNVPMKEGAHLKQDPNQLKAVDR